MSDAQDLKPAQCDLSRELRACNARGNAIAAERKMAEAADVIDGFVEFAALIASRHALTSGELAVMDLLLSKTELP